MSPTIGDIRVDPKYPPGTPPEEIFEFEVWDGDKWLPAATAHDIVFHIGLGPCPGLADAFTDSEKPE
jgi:hypothetical protein